MTPAQRDLATAHTRFARGLAIHYARHSGRELDAAISDALLGLCQAAIAFDPARGVRFTTFAHPRILGALRDGARHADPLTRDDRKRLRAAERTGRRLTADEASLAQAAASPRPLHEPLPGGDPSTPLADAIADPHADTARDALARVELHDALDRIARRLRSRERTVLIAHARGATLQQIGDTLGVTETRISQIRRDALRRLAA